MDGVIIFKKAVEALQDTQGNNITVAEMQQTQVIPKRTILRLRVIEDLDDTTNPSTLRKIALRVELPSVFDPLGAANPDVVTLGQLDNPSDATIPSFFGFVDEVQAKLSSNADEVVAFRNTFP